MNKDSIVSKIEKYYSRKIRKYGPTPLGVDWNGEASQNLRFRQLSKIIMPDVEETDSKAISLLDFGCGYGALLTYLNQKELKLDYTGFDISKEMIQTATKLHSSTKSLWISTEHDLKQYDYVIASGIFNVMERISIAEWEEYITNTLSRINRIATKGFSFNLLTKYSDNDKMKSNLFYADPSKYFDHCKTQYSKSVALLHDYPLYEFTILVKKNII